MSKQRRITESVLQEARKLEAAKMDIEHIAEVLWVNLNNLKKRLGNQNVKSITKKRTTQRQSVKTDSATETI